MIKYINFEYIILVPSNILVKIRHYDIWTICWDKEAFVIVDSSSSSNVKLDNGEYVEVEIKSTSRVTTKQGTNVIHDALCNKIRWKFIEYIAVESRVYRLNWIQKTYIGFKGLKWNQNRNTWVSLTHITLGDVIAIVVPWQTPDVHFNFLHDPVQRNLVER